jgi:hypothetical protein
MKTIIALILLSLAAINVADARHRPTFVCAWSNLDWSQLTSGQRSLWSRLGGTQLRWNSDEAPASEQKDWSELTASERDAATQLGFRAGTWEAVCGANSEDSDRTERSREALEFASPD